MCQEEPVLLQLPICCVTPGKPPSLSGLQRNKRTRVFPCQKAESTAGVEETHVLEGHLSSLQLPWLALNSYLSPQQALGPSQLCTSWTPSKKTEAQGLPVRTRQEAEHPCPTKGSEALQNSPLGGPCSVPAKE